LKVIIRNETGLHARPAAMLVKEAGQFDEEVYVVKGGQKYNAKSIMSVMSSAISCGDEIEIISENESAVSHLVSFLENLTDQ